MSGQGRGRVKTHRDLDVWKAAVELAGRVYVVTREFPEEERFGLVSQMRRAAVSVASNIAEGAGRQTDIEFVRFLYMASGSASELDTQLEISMMSGVGMNEALEDLQAANVRVSKMLHGLIRAMKARTAGG